MKQPKKEEKTTSYQQQLVVYIKKSMHNSLVFREKKFNHVEYTMMKYITQCNNAREKSSITKTMPERPQKGK